MIRLTLRTLTVGLLLSVPTAANDPDADARIEALEAQVIELTQQIADLQALVSGLRSDLATISSAMAVAGQATPTPATGSISNGCRARLIQLRTRRDDLKALGLTDGHPDVRSLLVQMRAVGRECYPDRDN